MSLDVYLTADPTDFEVAADLCEENGFAEQAAYLRERGEKEVYWSNITHNLGRMADEAGIYKACWRPEEIGVTKARQLIPLLKDGLAKLRADPAHFEQFNASNGWGLYEDFVPWVSKYLAACEEYPDADVSVSR